MTAALITAGSTVLGAIISGAVALLVAGRQHSKTVALVEYRLNELEKKVDKHNNLVERMYEVEKEVALQETKIEDLMDEK